MNTTIPEYLCINTVLCGVVLHCVLCAVRYRQRNSAKTFEAKIRNRNEDTADLALSL
jgi:hypothetical protein